MASPGTSNGLSSLDQHGGGGYLALLRRVHIRLPVRLVEFVLHCLLTIAIWMTIFALGMIVSHYASEANFRNMTDIELRAHYQGKLDDLADWSDIEAMNYHRKQVIELESKYESERDR